MKLPQIGDKVSHDLPGAVIGVFPPPVRLHYRDSFLFDRFGGTQKIPAAVPFPQGIDWRMGGEEEEIWESTGDSALPQILLKMKGLFIFGFTQTDDPKQALLLQRLPRSMANPI